MKKEKVELEELQVESFVTSLDDEAQRSLKGGTTASCAYTISIATFTVIYTYEKGKEASLYFCEEEEKY